MRIAHFVHGLGLGGAQKVIGTIVSELRDRFDFSVFSSGDGVLAAELRDAGADIRIVERLIPRIDPIWIGRLTRALREDGIDLVHAHLFGDSLHGYFAARRAGLPIVMTLHNVAQRFSGIQARGYRYLIPRCDRVVGCSGQVTQSFRDARYPGSADIVTIHNGIPDPRRAQAAGAGTLLADLGVAPGGIVLATAGRLTREKGHRILLEALGLLSPEQRAAVSLVILGSGPLLDELRADAAARGLGDRVVFAGFRDDVPQLLAQVDAIVFSSLHEGLPLAMLEAMAASRCVVATRVGGIPSAIDDDVDGLLVDPADPAGLAAALARVIDDAALRTRLGAAARRRFERTFDSASMTQAYGRLYQEFASR